MEILKETGDRDYELVLSQVQNNENSIALLNKKKKKGKNGRFRMKKLLNHNEQRGKYHN